MKGVAMRNMLIPAVVLAAAVLALAGCPLLDTGVTVTGTLWAEYFSISSDVTVTVTQGDASVSVDVPLVSGGSTQTGAFLVANVPTGTYSVEVTFENGDSYSAWSEYSVNGGSWIAVDNEVVTGGSAPYTFTITIDSLTIEADTMLDINFGNAG
jgi:hypothetical protein